MNNAEVSSKPKLGDLRRPDFAGVFVSLNISYILELLVLLN